MFALLAVVVFAIAAIGPNNLGIVELVPLGLAFTAAHLLIGGPVIPESWRRR